MPLDEQVLFRDKYRLSVFVEVKLAAVTGKVERENVRFSIDVALENIIKGLVGRRAWNKRVIGVHIRDILHSEAAKEIPSEMFVRLAHHCPHYPAPRVQAPAKPNPARRLPYLDAGCMVAQVIDRLGE